MSSSYDGKHVVITGASGNLGSAVVEAFWRAGATCHVPLHLTRPPPGASWAADARTLQKEGTPERPDGRERVHLVRGIDLTVERDVEAYFHDLPPLWGLVHLVGGFAMAPVEDTLLGDVDALFTLNARTCFLCCREAVRSMRKGACGGRIVNVAARPAVQPVAGMIAYTIAKSAVVAITRALAVELHRDRIFVNAVIPSLIDTPVNRTSMPDSNFDVWPKPDEIARSIAFLASPDNQLTSGSLVPVYGQA